MALTNCLKRTLIICFALLSFTTQAEKEPILIGDILKVGLKHPENARRVAILLNVSLGYFGVHRMYLGTDPKVPIFYTLSMGGGGLLWLVDLGILIAQKDIEPYINNPRMFMWAGKN